MKKLIIFTLMLIMVPINVLGIEYSSQNVYFYNLDRDHVIYEDNSHEEISIASMTKMMTAWVAIEHIPNLDAEVTLTNKDFKGLIEANASVAGFYVGEVVTYRDLLYGLLLPSGADAALALSNNIAGSEENFVKMMNDKAKALGLENTHFANTTGLDQDGHYSSVYDVAVILQNALKNDNFKEIFTTKSYITSNKKHKFESTLLKSSKQYDLDTDYILGSKSGYTYDAGLCLASIAEHDGDLYILVTARADYRTAYPYHITDSNMIYQYYFDNYSYQVLQTKDDVIVTLKDVNDTEFVYKADETVELYLPNDVQINKEYKGEELLTPEMSKGDVVGKYDIYADDELVYSQNISLEEKILDYDQIIFIITSISIMILVLIIAIFVVIFKRRKKKRKRSRK